MNATVSIDRIEVFAHHGVMEQERRVGNKFAVSLRLEYNCAQAARTDDVAHALNYAEVVDEVNAVMARPCRLLETVAANIREALARRFPQITAGSVTVAKLHPPFPTRVAEVSVTINW